MQFEEFHPRLLTVVASDFQPMAEVSFPLLASTVNAKKRKETSASREIENQMSQPICVCRNQTQDLMVGQASYFHNSVSATAFHFPRQ